MKRIKAKNFDEFFESHMGKTAWKRGVDMFESGSVANLPDGIYEGQLVSAKFDIPRHGRPHVGFNYKLTDKGTTISKVIQVDKPQGVCALLQEYLKLQIPMHEVGVDKIRWVSQMVEKFTPEVILTLTTNKEGIQTINVQTAIWPTKQTQKEEPAPAPAKAPKKAEKTAAPVDVQPAPESAAEVTPEAPVATKEVELKKGMLVRYETDTISGTGEIKAIYEDDGEVSVMDTRSNTKIVVPGSAIVQVLAD